MNYKIENILWDRVKKYLPYLHLVPFIQMVCVCNNLAIGKVDQDSDIDLFIIIKNKRIFTARLLITFLLHILRVRRHSNKVEGRFCLSFFIDDSELSLQNIALEKDFYLAMWIYSLVPIIDTRLEEFSMSKLFILENSWIYSYFPKNSTIKFTKERQIHPSSISQVLKFLCSIPFLSYWGDFIEYFAKKWQLSRSLRKVKNLNNRSGVIINEHMLKFHNLDRRKDYNLKWQTKYGKDSVLDRKRFLEII